jgi:hypothetical protein
VLPSGFAKRRTGGFVSLGGVALQRWGEPRETVDVDLTLLTGKPMQLTIVSGALSDHVAVLLQCKA